MIGTIKIKDLLLRTYIGFNLEELVNKQDVIINITIEALLGNELNSDLPDNIVNYKTITKKVIHFVQDHQFKLLEKLTFDVLSIIYQDERIVYCKVEIDKPHALRFAESVSFCMEKRRAQNQAILGVGSNIEPKENIEKAIQILKENCSIEKVSQWIETDPIGITDQDKFVNGAIQISSHLDQKSLNNFLKEIEDRLNRDRTLPKFGPRTIDLDIVVWNGKVIDTDYYERDFLKKSVDELTV